MVGVFISVDLMVATAVSISFRIEMGNASGNSRPVMRIDVKYMATANSGNDNCGSWVTLERFLYNINLLEHSQLYGFMFTVLPYLCQRLIVES